MKINNTGCALCNSTWGNYYKTIENTEMFFCCDVCASIFEDIVNRLKKLYNLENIDYLSLSGTPRQRNYSVEFNTEEYNGIINFSNDKILKIIDKTS